MGKELVIEQIHVKQLMRGERPEGMDFAEFKIKRKMVQKFLQGRLKNIKYGISGK